MEINNSNIKSELSKVKEDLFHMEARSMRNSLLFHVIPEEVSENCGEVLQVFPREKLMLYERIDFEGVYRMGRPRMGPSPADQTWPSLPEIKTENVCELNPRKHTIACLRCKKADKKGV